MVAFCWNDLFGIDKALPDLENNPLLEPESSSKASRRQTLPKSLRDTLHEGVLLRQTAIRVKRMVRPPDSLEVRYFDVERAILEGDGEHLAPRFAETGRRLLEIAEASRERGIQVISMVFPMENSISRNYPDAVFVEPLREIWSETDMPFIDLEPPFHSAHRAGRNPLLPYDLHPSPEGMRIAAQRLEEIIVSHNLLDQQAIGN